MASWNMAFWSKVNNTIKNNSYKNMDISFGTHKKLAPIFKLVKAHLNNRNLFLLLMELKYDIHKQAKQLVFCYMLSAWFVLALSHFFYQIFYVFRQFFFSQHLFDHS